MNKLLITLFATMFLVACGTEEADADDNWNTSEHNYNVNGDKWGLEIRAVGNDDYDHVEGSLKLTDSLTAAVRYAEDGETTEIRPKLTHSLLSVGPVGLKHRIEYRYFEGNTTDDSWRYRIIAKMDVGPIWVKAEPRWTLGGDQKTDAKIDDIKYEAGYDWTLSSTETTSAVFTPYIQYQTSGDEGDYAKEHMILGTRLQVKF
jgi:hypothetical protein